MAPFSFQRAQETFEIAVTGPLIANTIEMYVSAGIAGLGILNGFEDDLNEHLETGALVPVLPEWWRVIPGPFLYYSSRRLMRPAFRAFVDYVKRVSPRRQIQGNTT